EENGGEGGGWESGLTCGRTSEVPLEPVALDRTDDITARLYDRVRGHAAAGGRGALVTRLDGNGTEAVGAKLLVLDDGATEGSLGEAFLDQRFAGEARGGIARGGPPTLVL